MLSAGGAFLMYEALGVDRAVIVTHFPEAIVSAHKK